MLRMNWLETSEPSSDPRFTKANLSRGKDSRDPVNPIVQNEEVFHVEHFVTTGTYVQRRSEKQG